MRTREARQPELDTIGFQTMLDDFAASRQQHNEALAVVNGIAHESHIAAHAERLAYIDLETPCEEHPEDVARSALALYIYERKFTEARMLLNGMKNNWYTQARELIAPFLGKRVCVTALDPERSSIGTSKLNEFGYYDGMGQWHNSVTGRISNISLDLNSGGGMSLRKHGASKKLYITGQLTNDDFEPNYTVEFL